MPEINDNAIIDAKHFQIAWIKIKDLFASVSTAINQNTTNITNLTSTATQHTTDIANLTSTASQFNTDLANLSSAVTSLNTVASTATNGLMSSEDKDFIDNIKDNCVLQIGQVEITQQNFIDLLDMLNNNS